MPPTKQPIRLVIELSPEGKVNVAGPIHDLILCFGLLESAKHTIYDHVTSQQKNGNPTTNIVAVPAGALPPLPKL